MAASAGGSGRRKGARVQEEGLGTSKDGHSVPSTMVASEVGQVAMSLSPRGSAQVCVGVAGQPRGGLGWPEVRRAPPLLENPLLCG